MPSTYSTSLKIELIANGEQSGTWGATTNNNLGTLIEQAITGVGSLTLTGGDYTLTNYNGLPDESRNAVLTFSGSLSAPANVIAPSVQKTYIITNNSGANVTIKTSSGNGVTIGNGLSSLIYCDGTNFYTAVNVNNVIGDLAVSGNETIGGSLTLGGNITLANTVTAGNLAMTANSGVITMAGNTGAFLPPTGTTAQRPASLTPGMSRWNTDLGVYEIWNGVNWQIIASGTYSGTYLVVAGGGGGGGGGTNTQGGGGGAGGLSTGSINFTSGTTYTVITGAGGAGSLAVPGNIAYNGSNSSITGVVVSVGGGHGGYGGYGGGNGGSGGGGKSNGGYVQATAGSGTSGQGYSGGDGDPFNQTGGAGGGGGAGAAGQGGGGGYGGAGGIGAASAITGSSTYYAGGGGGGTNTGTSSGGTGGGGAGGNSSGGGSSGTASTGGGGGGGSYNGSVDTAGGNGGSGIVILSIPTVSYTGTTTGSPTVTINGSNTILRFTSSGSYTA